MRPSWGRNQLNSVLNTKSEYSKHNFGLKDEIGWLRFKYQSFSFWRYGTLSFWALLHLSPSQLCFWPCQNLVSTHAPLFFDKVCVPKNNFRIACSKDDVNTPSAISHVLRTIIIYRPLLVWTSWCKLGWKLLSFYNYPVIRFHRSKPSPEPYCSPFR